MKNASVRHETAQEEDFGPDETDDRKSGFVDIRTTQKRTRGRLSLKEMIETKPDGPELATYILERLASAEDSIERMLELVPDKSLRLVLEERPRFARYAGERGERFVDERMKK